MAGFYDRSGAPMEMAAWQRKLSDSEYAIVEQTECGDQNLPESCLVSTVWLGHSLQLGNGPPLIFETMVFGGPLDKERDYYPTETAAIAGHDQMVARARQAILDLEGKR